MSEQQYIQGFNNGYTLARYEPNLVTKITKNLSPTNDYLDGFFSGKEEFELENSRDQLHSLQKLRDQSKNRENYLEKDL